ncbi:MAG: PP2C family protein-serine/threonine phosphatase [Ardenticatenaceae bacterium]
MMHKTGPIKARNQAPNRALNQATNLALNQAPKRIGLGFDDAVVQISIGSRSRKFQNEDSYWPSQKVSGTQLHAALEYLIAGRLYIVADGVSGGLAGHEASDLAARTIAQSYYATIFELAQPPTQQDIERALRGAIIEANRLLLMRSRELRAQNGLTDHKSLQTALICVVCRGQQLTIANVGDCRLYRYRLPQAARGQPLSGVVELLSQADHSTKYFVGAHLQHDQISIYQKSMAAQDILILCSDGLYKYLATDNDPAKAAHVMARLFERYCRSGGIRRVARHLLERADDAKQGGGADNITVMLIEPPPLRAFSVAGESLDELIKAAWGLPQRAEQPPPPIFARLGEIATQLAEQANGPPRALWERRAAQLGAPNGLKELQQAEARYHQLGFDFEENHLIVQQIWALYEQAPHHPPLAKLALEAVVDLGNTALLATDSQKESKLRQAFDLLSPLRHTLFQQIDQAEEADAQEVLSQLEIEITETTQNQTAERAKKASLRHRNLFWLIVATVLILLAVVTTSVVLLGLND